MLARELETGTFRYAWTQGFGRWRWTLAKLAPLAEKLPGSRMLDGRFMAVQQSVAIPKGREAGFAYLRAYVEEAKASGMVARSIEKAGFRGVTVAPRTQ